MRPYYQVDGVTIYHGDARDVLPRLPKGSADLVVTSPPYNCHLRYQGYSDDLPDEEFQSLNRTWLAETRRIVRDKGRVYAVVSDRMLWWMQPMFAETGWRFHQLLAWCKPNISGGGARISSDWRCLTEWILLAHAGKRSPMLAAYDINNHNFLVIPSPQTNWLSEPKEHVAQWPIELPLRLIGRTPGEVVLDPFCGSGASLLAAKMLGRQAIGIDLAEESCALAAERLSRQAVFAASDAETLALPLEV